MKIIDIILIASVVAIAVSIPIIAYKHFQPSGQCLQNPIAYGIKQIEEVNGGVRFEATGKLSKEGSPTFILNNEGISFYVNTDTNFSIQK